MSTKKEAIPRKVKANPKKTTRNTAAPKRELPSRSSEHMAVEESLREGEELFRYLFDHAAFGISITLPSGEINVNNAFCKILGYTQKELKNRKWQEITHPEDVELTQNGINLLLSGKKVSVSFSKRFIHKKGSIVWVDLSSTMRRDKDGKPLYMITTLTDITERKRVEENLRESEERYRAMMEQAADGVFVHDEAGRILDVNQKTCQTLGYSRKELLSRSIGDIDPEAIRAGKNKLWDRVFAGEQFTFDSCHTCKDGSIIPVEVTLGFVRLPAGQAILGIARDITKRKHDEEALRASEEKFRLAFMTGSDAYYWATLEEGRILEINPVFEEVFGYPRDEAIGRTSLELGLYNDPSDRARMISELKAKGFVKDLELKGRKKDGELIIASLSVSKSVINNQMYILGIIRDITERKKADEKLRESEERYRELFETESDSIFLIENETGRIHDANSSAAALYGYTLDELLSLRDVDLSAEPETIQQATRGSTVTPGQTVTIPLRYHRKKDGTVFPVEITGRFFNRHGNLFRVAAIRDITERKQAEEALRASEAKFRAVVENSNDGILFGDANAKISYRSPSYRRINGYSDDERIGHIGFETVHPDDAENFRRYWGKILAHPEISHNAEYRIRHKDGSWRWIETTGQNLLDKPDVNSVVLTSRDITARKQAAEMLRMSEQTAHHIADQLRMVNTIGGKIAAGLNFERLMQTIYEQCQKIGDTDIFYIALHDEATGNLNFPFYIKDGEKRAIANLTSRDKTSMTEYIIKLRETLYLPNLSNLPTGVTPVRNRGKWTRSFLGVPLVLNKQVVGVISMQSYALNAYTPEQIQMVELLATQLAIAIQNSQLYENVQRELNERRQAEENLRRRSEELTALQATLLDLSSSHSLPKLLNLLVERAARLLDAPSGGLYLTEPDQRKVRCAVSYKTKSDFTGTVLDYGVGAAGWVAKTGQPLIIEDYSKWRARAGVFEKNQPFQAVMSAPMLWQGKVSGVIHLLRDDKSKKFTPEELSLLTIFANHAAVAVENARLFNLLEQELNDHKRVEEALIESEMRYRNFYENVHDVVYQTDFNGILTDISPSVENRYGYTRTELLGARVEDFFFTQEEYQSLDAAMERGGSVNDFEIRLKHKDGSPIHVSTTSRIIFDAQNKPIATEGVLRDITERKQAEEALRESEERFSRLSAATSEGIAISENGILLDANPQLANMLGDDPLELIGSSAMNFVAPESRDLVTANMRAGVEGPYEHLAVRKDGSIFPVEIRARMIPFKGRQTRVTIIRDITERKQAEEKLRESEERFRALIEQSHDAITLLTSEGTVLYDSPSITRVLGYSPTERIGRKMFEFVLPEEREGMRQGFARFARQKGAVALSEFHFIHKDGSTRNIEGIRTNLLHEPAVGAIVVNYRDITERKQTQILQEAVYRIAAAAETTRSLDELYPQIHQIISSVMPAENFFITLYDEAKNLLRFPYFKNAKDEPYMAGVQPGKGLSAYVLRTGKSLLCTQAVHDELERRGKVKLLGEPSAIWLGVPLVVEGKTIGAMVVQHYSDPNAYSEREQHMLEFVSTQVAIAIDRMRNEEEILKLNVELEQRVEERTRELREAQEKIIRQEKLATLGQLAGTMSHELRNPLGVINNSIYYLKLTQPEASEKIKQHHDMIEQEVHTAEKIITDLLDFVRMETISQEPVSVRELVQRTLVRFPVPEPIQLTLKLPERLPNVFTDPRQMEQVLGNLILNACQAMAVKSAATSVKEVSKLTISAHAQKEMVAIAVKDTGSGIIPEYLNLIFEPLFTTKSKGIGLGLAISKKLVEANGGRIEVQSEPGIGSTFTLWLPLTLPENN